MKAARAHVKPPAPPPPTGAPAAPADVPDLDDLIPVAEACKLLKSHRPGRRVHVSTLYRWIFAGRLRGWRRGSAWFVSRRDLARLHEPVPMSGAYQRPARPPSATERELQRQREWTKAVLDRAGI